MEKKQIIKALECCTSGYCYVGAGCPLAEDDNYDDDIAKCTSELAQNALALIKELTKENERLNKQNEELQEVANTAVGSFIRLETHYKFECKRADTIKANTVREFAERLKGKIKVLVDRAEEGKNDHYIAHPHADKSVGYYAEGKIKGLLDIDKFIDQITKEILNKTEEEKK